jgi:hypothetical protein
MLIFVFDLTVFSDLTSALTVDDGFAVALALVEGDADGVDDEIGVGVAFSVLIGLVVGAGEFVGATV